VALVQIAQPDVTFATLQRANVTLASGSVAGVTLGRSCHGAPQSTPCLAGNRANPHSVDEDGTLPR